MWSVTGLHVYVALLLFIALNQQDCSQCTKLSMDTGLSMVRCLICMIEQAIAASREGKWKTRVTAIKLHWNSGMLSTNHALPSLLPS